MTDERVVPRVARPAGRHSPRWMPALLAASLLVAVTALVLSGEGRRALTALGGASLWHLSGLLLAGLCLPVVHALRWRAMLAALDERIPARTAIDLTVTSSLLNYAAPGGYLWAPAKGLLARQLHGVRLGRSVPTLAVEQGLDALALVIGATAGLLLGGPRATGWLLQRAEPPSPAAVVLLAALAAGGAVGLLASRRHVARFWETVGASARLLMATRELRAPLLGLTAARWLLDVAAVWLALGALGIDVGLGGLLLISNLPLLVGLISPLPGGVGFREGAMVATAGVLRLPLASVLAAALVHRLALLAALPLLLAGLRLTRWGRA